MELRYKHTGKIKGGKRVYDDPALLQRYLLTLEDCEFEEFTRLKRVPASSQQKAFYIGVILKEAHKNNAFVHYDKPKDIHDSLLADIFLKEYVVTAGKLTTKIKKLEDLSSNEIWDLTERVIAYLATEHGIELKQKDNYYIKE